MRLDWCEADPVPSLRDYSNEEDSDGDSMYKKGSNKKEKDLICWKKQKYDPTRFKQLHSQGSYLVWKTQFLIHVDWVECTSMVDLDPKYNKESLTDPYDIELYEAKNLFFWGVLEHVMIDTAPRNTLYRFEARMPDTRAAYFAIDEELSRSIIQDSSINESLTKLFLTKYEDFKGTREDFLFMWHTLLRKHNTVAGKHSALRYPTIRSFLHGAVNSCPEMRRSFLTIPKDGESEEDIALMFAEVRGAAKFQDLADKQAKTTTVNQVQQFLSEAPQEALLESYKNKLDPSLRIPSHIYSKWDLESKQGLAQFSNKDRQKIVSFITSSTHGTPKQDQPQSPSVKVYENEIQPDPT